MTAEWVEWKEERTLWEKNESMKAAAKSLAVKEVRMQHQQAGARSWLADWGELNIQKQCGNDLRVESQISLWKDSKSMGHNEVQSVAKVMSWSNYWSNETEEYWLISGRNCGQSQVSF